MRQIKIGETTETVVERSDYPPEKIRQILGNELDLVSVHPSGIARPSALNGVLQPFATD